MFEPSATFCFREVQKWPWRSRDEDTAVRVVQIAPPWFPIPPHGYGGIELVIAELTEGLIAAGHDVTLFAPSGARTSARLIPTMARGLGLDMTEAEKASVFHASSRAAHQVALDLHADLIHDHTDFAPDPGYPIPIVRTMHGPATAISVVNACQMSAAGDHFVAISHRQRELFTAAAAARYGPGQHIAFAGMVYNPIDVAAAPFYPRAAKGDGVAFVGRCHWEKGPDAAIRIARAAGIPLKLALRVTTDERPYFDTVIRPLLVASQGLAGYVGEVSGQAKDDLLGQARAVIFSSPWEEPFGLVLT
nr:glycosyltransferase [Chloroflexia bacterium]